MSNSIGLTENVKAEVRQWASELKHYNDWLARANTHDIVKFLNDRQKLCTPGFVLRRHLQSTVADSSSLCDLDKPLRKLFDDHPQTVLNESLNVPRDSDFVSKLSTLLGKSTFDGCTQLTASPVQWCNYLTDSSVPNRETAIKLGFALRMDGSTLKKFLLSADKPLLNVRNPFDFICGICLDCGLNYSDVLELLSEFEAQRKLEPDAQPTLQPTIDTTIELKNETARLVENDTIPIDEIKQQLLTFMLEHSAEFVGKIPRRRSTKQRENAVDPTPPMEYASGFSLQNLARLRRLLRYLTILYPKIETLDENHCLKIVALETEADGMPTNVQQLIQAMFDSQNLEFLELAELIDATPEQLNPRGALKRSVDKIPLNKSVVLLLKNLPKTLRAILRPLEHPATAQDLDRGTVLILTYFLLTAIITGADEHQLDLLRAELDADEQHFDEQSAQSVLVETVSDTLDTFRELDPQDVDVQDYIKAFNDMLDCFELEPLYMPFLLDRCVLLCLTADPLDAPLLGDDDLQYLLNLVLDLHYQSIGEDV